MHTGSGAEPQPQLLSTLQSLLSNLYALLHYPPFHYSNLTPQPRLRVDPGCLWRRMPPPRVDSGRFSFALNSVRSEVGTPPRGVRGGQGADRLTFVAGFGEAGVFRDHRSRLQGCRTALEGDYLSGRCNREVMHPLLFHLRSALVFVIVQVRRRTVLTTGQF